MVKRKPQEKTLSEKLSEPELRKLRKEIRQDYQEGYSFEEIRRKLSDEYRLPNERLEEILASEFPQLQQQSRTHQKTDSDDLVKDIKNTSLGERIGGALVFGGIGYFTGYVLFPLGIEKLTNLGRMPDNACLISAGILTAIGVIKGLATGFKTYYN